jgi:hypothetical protein
MTKTASELRYQMRNTAAFIAADVSTLVLIPRLTTKNASGYSTVDGTPRRPQRFRLIDQSSSVVGNEPGRLRSSEGQQRKATHQLLGFDDCEWAVGDYWTDEIGGRYEIDELLPDNGYERRAKVIRYGPQ